MFKMQVWIFLFLFLWTIIQTEGQNVDKAFVPVFINSPANINNTSPFTTALFKGTFLNLIDLSLNGELTIIRLSF